MTVRWRQFYRDGVGPTFFESKNLIDVIKKNIEAMDQDKEGAC